MPDMDGFEVCRRLRESAETAEIPVIFLTADFQGKDKVAHLGLGAVDCCIKPFKSEELSTRIRASLKAKQLIEQDTMIDGLTGLWNQKYLEEQAATESALAIRSRGPLSCVLLDVDGLRLINSKYGIPAGDEVLRSIGKILLGRCRSEDAACRTLCGKVPAISAAGHEPRRCRLPRRPAVPGDPATTCNRSRSRSGSDVQLWRRRYSRHRRCLIVGTRRSDARAGKAQRRRLRLDCPAIATGVDRRHNCLTGGPLLTSDTRTSTPGNEQDSANPLSISAPRRF